MSIKRIFYKTLNPVVTALLRSPLHRIASGSLALLHFRGRKSGREFVTPLSYTREGSTIRLMSAQTTRWWINLRGSPVSVSVEIAGKIYPGEARLWEGDSEPLREGVERFLTALPRDAKVYGIKLERSGKPHPESIASVASELVLVEVELEANTEPKRA